MKVSINLNEEKIFNKSYEKQKPELKHILLIVTIIYKECLTKIWVTALLQNAIQTCRQKSCEASQNKISKKSQNICSVSAAIETFW